MQSTTETLLPAKGDRALPIRPNGFQETPGLLLQPAAARWDDSVLLALQRSSVPALRLTLGLVFLWFVALKVFGVSPITPMLKTTYPFLALPVFTVLLGMWEILIGLGLVLKLALRQTLCLLCLHLAGTFAALWLAPSYFFLHGNPLVLTVNGEFVIKNLVLLAAGLVVAGNELSQSRSRVVQGATKQNVTSSDVIMGPETTDV
jgi:uncharacterized membrane protein YkgB